jgi:serine/threonine-protein kinase
VQRQGAHSHRDNGKQIVRADRGARPRRLPADASAAPSDLPAQPSSAASGTTTPVPHRAPVAEAATVGGPVEARVPLPPAYGPWKCGENYTWSPGHPAIARPCYATGPSMRVMGSMKAAPGVKVDLTVSVHDADTDAESGRRYTCRDVLFTDVAPGRTCGPFDLKPERGHRYVVVLSWKYSEISEIPGGLVRGDVVNW